MESWVVESIGVAIGDGFLSLFVSIFGTMHLIIANIITQKQKP
jgi:hypothetical protein